MKYFPVENLSYCALYLLTGAGEVKQKTAGIFMCILCTVWEEESRYLSGQDCVWSRLNTLIPTN